MSGASLRNYFGVVSVYHIDTQLHTIGYTPQLNWLKRGWIQHFTHRVAILAAPQQLSDQRGLPPAGERGIQPGSVAAQQVVGFAGQL